MIMKTSVKIVLILALLSVAVFFMFELQDKYTPEKIHKPTLFNDEINETPTVVITPAPTPSSTNTDIVTPEPTPTATPVSRLPEGFVYVTDIIPDAILDIRYYGEDNFVGKRIDGYKAPVAIMTAEAALALKNAADLLYEQGYRIIIYDAYRPVKAVEHFVRWSQDPEDTKMKEKYYPAFYKSYLIDNYISSRSTHSRGSTIDLSLTDLEGNEINMGGYFDLFDGISRYDSDKITSEQRANRKILRDAMVQCGFTPSNGEWWHFRLTEEPFADIYFDFDVE